MKHIMLLAAALLCSGIVLSQSAGKTCRVRNTTKNALTDAPVILQIQDTSIKGVTVYEKGKEIPSQLDDLNGDGIADEIVFLSDFKGKEKKEFTIRYSATAFPAGRYPARVNAQMFLKKDKKIVPADVVSTTVDTMYNYLHHHGPAFESELIAYRLYYDKKQTVDLYGKYNKQLELARSLWYPTDEQLAEGFGDDILLVGGSVSVGTLRGWDGTKAIHISPVDKREARVIAKGPLRTVVDMTVTGWKYGGRTIGLQSRYILYAGHRDAEVYNIFTGDTEGLVFCTGVQKMPEESMRENGKDRVAVWGTGYPVNDTIKYGKQTVGMAVDLRKAECTGAVQDKVNYLYLVKPDRNNEINYRITACSKKEKFGYHTPDEFFRYAEKWAGEPYRALEISY